MANQDNIFDLIARMNREGDPSVYCRDDLDSNVAQEQAHYSQIKQFLQTAREDGAMSKLPEGSDYVLLSLIGKDMLNRSSRRGWASILTGLTLAFRTLTPIPIDEVGEHYRTVLNCAIYNMRNKLLMDWFDEKGIFTLVNNQISANKQMDKVPFIKKALEFRTDDPPRHDIYLLKTKNFIPQGITHKLDEQFVKQQVSEFSMEWNPNVELSSACGRGAERATTCT